MLNIKTFRVNPISENCYIANDETKETVIIDCGCFSENEWAPIKRYIKENDLKVVHLLNTHLHFDHALGIPFAYKEYGLKPEANTADLSIYNGIAEQIEMFIGAKIAFPQMPSLEKNLRDGEIITFGNHKFMVIQTPGHTPGSICFYCENEAVLFSGDTLFQGSIGRTDLEGGNSHDMMNSLTRLKELPKETNVYPGHGGTTNIGWECDFNPYFPI
ncbi:MAG: MBL fold metallo-hydrolase [Bacteroidaceae bacterium]|nr:MBL fold metallo-hydrolase [Bacteroidaceae bacterium]